MIQQLIDSSVILDRLEQSDKSDVLSELVDAALASGAVPDRHATAVRKQLQVREKRGSTGIGNGVAVPHVKLDDFDGLVLTLARTADGIEWAAIDGRPVHTIFLLISSTDRASDHLEVLRWVSSLARNADFRRFVLSAGGGDEIRDLLREMSGPA